jgi:4-amino-4-deoxy-L-arabinose transferase-like glycosyltransferase
MTHRLLRLLPVALIVLLGFGLRVHLLGQENFNWDEGYTFWIVRLPFTEMIDTTARDVHPPLHYMLLRASRALIGDGEFALRFPSVLLGTLGVALAYGLGRAVGGHGAGLLAMLLLAVSRAQIDISQLARMHIPAALFATGALWATLRLWANPRRHGAVVAYVLCVAGALYSFYLAVMLPLATNLAFIYAWLRQGRPRRLLVTWLLAQAAVVVLFAPWAGYALGRMHGWSAEQPTSLPFFLQFYFVTLTTGIPTHWNHVLPLVGAALLTVAAGTALVAYRARNSAEHLSRLALLLAATLTPILVVFLLTLPVHNLGRPLAARYLPLLAAGFCALAAWGMVTAWRRGHLLRLVSTAGAVIVFGAALYGLSTYYEGRILRDQFASVVATLRAHRHPGDAMILHNDRAWTMLTARYPDGDWVNVPNETTVNASYANFLLEPVWQEADAVWLLRIDESLVNDPGGEIESWLESRALDMAVWDFGNHVLTLYARISERGTTLRDLAPDYALPVAEVADEANGALLGFDLPALRRYPTGSDLYLALYWDEPPPPVTIELAGGDNDTTREFAFDAPPDAAAPFRQLLRIPLMADLPEGRYRLTLLEPEHTELQTITMVSTIPQLDAVSDEIANPLGYRLGDSIELVGYDVSALEFSPGDRVEITVYWRAREAIDTAYKVSVYALGEQFNPATGNPLWGQQDTEPLQWQLPTTRWPPGVVIRDEYVFDLAEDTPPGEYELGLVMYRPVDGQRLPVYDAGDQRLGDAARLATLTVR